MTTLNDIFERIEIKQRDYREYNFTPTENDALKTFFDLSQENDSIENLCLLCVAVPKSFFNLDARLYLIDQKSNELSLVASTEDEATAASKTPPPDVRPSEHVYSTGRDSMVLTLRGKKLMIDQLPFKTEDDVLGILEVHPASDIGRHDELFFRKYANRIAYNIHNSLLREKNIEHLRFIRTLVADIEHNVIVPNMIYKLFLRKLKGKIMKNKEIEKTLKEKCLSGEAAGNDYKNKIVSDISEANSEMIEEFENIERHYKNMSLFLETLFRKSHFDQGHLTLRTKVCNMKKDVVVPQIERYAEIFGEKGITIDDKLSGIPDEETIGVVDVGLIAQVYANLFSNALKYTQEITTDWGEKKKYISYGHEVIRDFFGPGKDGLKYNVYSTGNHINPDEREKLFEEEYRGSNTGSSPGTGHGLAFIKNAIEIHGGIAGYEATPYGNNFYFILPR